MRGDHSQKTSAVVIELGKFFFFFVWLWEVVANETTGPTWRFDSIISLMKYTRFCNCCCQWNWPWCKENDVIIVYCSDKKHWFPILINYGYGCILTKWTCLWLGTCNIIIRWQIIDFCRSGNNPRRVHLFVVNVYLRGRYLHVFEGVAYFIFKYFSLKITFVFVSNGQKTI